MSERNLLIKLSRRRLARGMSRFTRSHRDVRFRVPVDFQLEILFFFALGAGGLACCRAEWVSSPVTLSHYPPRRTALLFLGALLPLPWSQPSEGVDGFFRGDRPRPGPGGPFHALKSSSAFSECVQ